MRRPKSGRLFAAFERGRRPPFPERARAVAGTWQDGAFAPDSGDAEDVDDGEFTRVDVDVPRGGEDENDDPASPPLDEPVAFEESKEPPADDLPDSCDEPPAADAGLECGEPPAADAGLV